MFKTSKNTLNKEESGVTTEQESRREDRAKGKVWVGMSGGVDSSVSALLLKQAGFDVTGVFIKVWQPDNGECTWKDERRDAMRVAAQLDIPFLTLDFSKEYKKEVVDYMISEYRLGRTPNPDVMCNRAIKFGSFLSAARDADVDFVATGHYAQNIFNERTKSFELCEGKDKNKDQSYFLWTLGQEDLKHTLFPVGHLEKPEVRRIAEKNKLPVFDKKDSQGICFLGHVDMKEFLKEYVETKEGDVLDTEGNVIGQHEGAILYTIGERHGFHIFAATPDEKPRYVISKNFEQNTITVGDLDESIERGHKSTHIAATRWVKGEAPVHEVAARLRYRSAKVQCSISPNKKDKTESVVKFIETQKAITPGQSCVVYDGEVCLGGGIIA